LPGGPPAAAPPTITEPTRGTNPVAEPGSPPPIVITAAQNVSSIDWDKVVYVVFDLETTGRMRQCSEIIELAAVILDENGIQIEDATFIEFVKPTTPIPQVITQLTNITNDMVSGAESFSVVAADFIWFMEEHADNQTFDHVILVGHNAKAFNIPIFAHQLRLHNMSDTFFQDDRFGFGIDTLQLARKAVLRSKSRSLGIPSAYNL
jgi:DNA polymerase-3 subunit alpha (Gram-positive type)